MGAARQPMGKCLAPRGSDAGRMALGPRLRLAFARMRSPDMILAVIFLVILSYLILYPLLELVLRSITWTARDLRMFRMRDAEPGDLTLHFWNEMFAGMNSSQWLWVPLRNTLFTGGVAATLAIIIGSVMAWLVTRTDLPGRGWLKPLLTLPYIVPSFAIALAWETLFKS